MKLDIALVISTPIQVTEATHDEEGIQFYHNRSPDVP